MVHKDLEQLPTVINNEFDDILEDLQARIHVLQLEELASLRHNTTSLQSEQHQNQIFTSPILKVKLISNLRVPHAQNTHLLTQQNSMGLASNSRRGLQQSEPNLPSTAKLSVVTWLNSTTFTSIFIAIFNWRFFHSLNPLKPPAPSI
jgi:hypothetical protein